MTHSSRSINESCTCFQTDTAFFSNFLYSLYTEVNGSELSEFFSTDIQPVLGTHTNLFGKFFARRFRGHMLNTRLPIIKHGHTVTDHTGHCAAAGKEMPITKRIAGNHYIGRNLWIIADTLNQTEQLRPISHLSLFQLFFRYLEYLGCFLNIKLVEKTLMSGKKFNGISIRVRAYIAGSYGIKYHKIGNLYQDPTDLWVILVPYRNLTNPIFITFFIECRCYTATQPPIDEHIDKTGKVVGLRNQRAITIIMVDYYILLLKIKTFSVSRINALSNNT